MSWPYPKRCEAAIGLRRHGREKWGKACNFGVCWPKERLRLVVAHESQLPSIFDTFHDLYGQRWLDVYTIPHKPMDLWATCAVWECVYQGPLWISAG